MIDRQERRERRGNWVGAIVILIAGVTVITAALVGLYRTVTMDRWLLDHGSRAWGRVEELNSTYPNDVGVTFVDGVGRRIRTHINYQGASRDVVVLYDPAEPTTARPLHHGRYGDHQQWMWLSALGLTFVICASVTVVRESSSWMHRGGDRLSGWYTDPDNASRLRWRDKGNWSPHVAAAWPMPAWWRGRMSGFAAMDAGARELCRPTRAWGSIVAVALGGVVGVHALLIGWPGAIDGDAAMVAWPAVVMFVALTIVVVFGWMASHSLNNDSSPVSSLRSSLRTSLTTLWWSVPLTVIALGTTVFTPLIAPAVIAAAVARVARAHRHSVHARFVRRLWSREVVIALPASMLTGTYMYLVAHGHIRWTNLVFVAVLIAASPVMALTATATAALYLDDEKHQRVVAYPLDVGHERR